MFLRFYRTAELVLNGVRCSFVNDWGFPAVVCMSKLPSKHQISFCLTTSFFPQALTELYQAIP